MQIGDSVKTKKKPKRTPYRHIVLYGIILNIFSDDRVVVKFNKSDCGNIMKRDQLIVGNKFDI